jgi:hypothetical protein
MRALLARDVGHREEHDTDAARRVAEREEVGQVKAADHREVLAGPRRDRGRGGHVCASVGRDAMHLSATGASRV